MSFQGAKDFVLDVFDRIDLGLLPWLIFIAAATLNLSVSGVWLRCISLGVLVLCVVWFMRDNKRMV